MDLDGIWYAVETCWSDELHTSCEKKKKQLKGENQTLTVLCKKKKKKKKIAIFVGLHMDS